MLSSPPSEIVIDDINFNNYLLLLQNGLEQPHPYIDGKHEFIATYMGSDIHEVTVRKQGYVISGFDLESNVTKCELEKHLLNGTTSKIDIVGIIENGNKQRSVSITNEELTSFKIYSAWPMEYSIPREVSYDGFRISNIRLKPIP